MAGEDLPQDVRQFLDNCIDSIEQLRVLLALHAQPEREWSASDLAVEMRSTESSIRKRLDDLYFRKVLVKLPELGDRHKFLPDSPRVEVIIKELAFCNEKRPYSVIDAIYVKPNKALKAFADAFKLRGDT